MELATEPLSPGQVARIVAKRAAEACIDEEERVGPDGRTERYTLRFAGHSMRRGVATAADAAGVGLLQFMAAAGWTSADIASRYVDRAQKPEDTPAAVVLRKRGLSPGSTGKGERNADR